MAHPFVKWAGGKTQLLPELNKRFPERFDNYVEPFVGGGSVLIDTLQKYPDLKNVIANDFNTELINVYRCIQLTPKMFIDACHDLETWFNKKYDKKSCFIQVREMYNATMKPEYETPCSDQAARFVFLNKLCFNGIYRVNSKGKFNVPFNNSTIANIIDDENIMELFSLFKKVTFINKDFSEVPFKFETGKTFVYMDPPYRPLNQTSNFASYTSNGFDDEMQVSLKAFCDELTSNGVSVLQSNSDPADGFFDTLYEGYTIERVSARRSINRDGTKRSKINEILISNV